MEYTSIIKYKKNEEIRRQLKKGLLTFSITMTAGVLFCYFFWDLFFAGNVIISKKKNTFTEEIL